MKTTVDGHGMKKKEFDFQKKLYAFVAQLNRAESTDEVFSAALDTILSALGTDRASILIFDANNRMCFVDWRGLSAAYRKAVEGHSPWKGDEEQFAPIVIEDVAFAELDAPLYTVIRREGIGALAFIPLVYKGRLLGKFMVYYDRPHVFAEEELQLAQTIAYQLAATVERKQVENALRQSEHRFRAMLEALPAVIYTTDPEGRITHYNQSAVEFSGRELTLGKDKWCVSWKLYDSDGNAMPHDQCPMALAMKEGRPVRGAEAVAERPDGRRIWFNAFPTPLRDTNGRITGGINMLVDITERKASEAALRASEERYRAVVESQMEMLCRFKPDGTILFVNQAYATARGTSQEDLMQANFWDFIAEEDRANVRAILDGLTPQNPVAVIENRFETIDGVRWTLWTNRALSFDASGSLVEAQSSGIDITDRKRIEEALKRAHGNLQDSHVELENRVKERTHLAEQRAEKLRKLASALTLAEQRERNRLAQILHDHLQQILIAIKIGINRIRGDVDAARLGSMIEQIEELNDKAIDASRSFAVELSPPILRDAGLAPAVEWLARWFKEKHALTVTVESEPELKTTSEDVRIFLFESVRELLLNVVKHAGTEHAWVRLSSGENEICVQVADCGKGFDAETLDKKSREGFGLFRLFERLELLGGRVDVESAPGEGARFSLCAPARAKESKPGVPQERENRKKAHKYGRRNGTISVLVADDHKILRQGLINLLNAEPDIEVLGEAADGEQAVRIASELMPDLVVMDISMPNMNGIEATGAIKAQCPDIRIVGLSLHDSEDMASTMLQVGASAYLNKSGPLDELVRTIRKVVNRTQAPTATLTTPATGGGSHLGTNGHARA